jgi:hypothetical protein
MLGMHCVLHIETVSLLKIMAFHGQGDASDL